MEGNPVTITIAAFLLTLLLLIRSGVTINADNRTKEILKTLFKNYDGEIRPLGHNGTGPVIVSVNLYLRSLEDMEETKFGLEWRPQFTFRMQWYDGRLAFKDKLISNPLEDKPLTVLTLPLSLSKRIWNPDLFFSNAKDVKVHTELAPNEYWKIYQDGEVLYSVRLTVSMICLMDMHKFPHDRQTCMMRMASYSFTQEDIIFIWKSIDPIQVTSAIHLPRFSLRAFTSDYCDAQTNTGVYSCLRGDFIIQRESGFYYDKIYIPLLLCVLTAWLTFWLHPVKASIPRIIILVGSLFYARAASDRLRDEVPIVSYSTAFDRWSSGCCLFIFVALCEFIVTSYLGTQNDQTHAPVVKNNETELLDISLLAENSQAQPQHGDIKLLRKLHLQTASAKVQKADWYMEKMDFTFRILYPICFVMFVIVYCAGIFEKP